MGASEAVTSQRSKLKTDTDLRSMCHFLVSGERSAGIVECRRIKGDDFVGMAPAENVAPSMVALLFGCWLVVLRLVEVDD